MIDSLLVAPVEWS